MAGRSMPGSVFRTNFAVPIRAPVFPALTQACARPSFTRSIATRIEEFFLVRIAVRTSSSIPTTSLAGMIESRSEPRDPRTLRIASSSPTSSSCASGCCARKSRLAGTVTDGPWSPPIASTAMTVLTIAADPRTSVLGLDDLLAAVETGRRDVVAKVRLAGGGLDRGRRLAEVVVRPVHAALRWRLLVLLNGHLKFLLASLLVAFEAGERREGRFPRRGRAAGILRLLEPRLAGHHRDREEDRVLDDVADVQRARGDQEILVVALFLDPRELRFRIHEDESLPHRNLVPESLEARLAREKNE